MKKRRTSWLLVMGLLLITLGLGIDLIAALSEFHPITGWGYFYSQPGGQDPAGVVGDFGFDKEGMWSTGEKTGFEGATWVKVCWLEPNRTSKILCGWSDGTKLKSTNIFEWTFNTIKMFLQKKLPTPNFPLWVFFQP